MVSKRSFTLLVANNTIFRIGLNNLFDGLQRKDVKLLLSLFQVGKFVLQYKIVFPNGKLIKTNTVKNK